MSPASSTILEVAGTAIGPQSFNTAGTDDVIVAVGYSNEFGYHRRREWLTITWASGEIDGGGGPTEKDIALKHLAHGACMVLAWMLLLPIGGAIPAFFRGGLDNRSTPMSPWKRSGGTSCTQECRWCTPRRT